MAGVIGGAHRGARPAGSLAVFFVLAFGWSWGFWSAAALGAREGAPVDQALVYTGIAGPLVAAVVMLRLRGSRAERRDFRRRIYEVERIRPAWLLPVLLLYPALTAAAVGLDLALGGSAPDTAGLLRLLGDPVLLLASVAYAFLLGPLLEEPGWRGYALDRLQALGGALGASLWLGALWALWHLPLFFVPGTYQQGLGLGTGVFWLFNLTAVAASVVITWIYAHNARSVAAAILFHATLNLTRDALPLPERTELVRTALLALVAVLIVRRCGARTLRACR